MKFNVTTRLAVIALFALSVNAFAGSPWAFFGGFGGSGSLNGGLRYNVNSDICIDASGAASIGDEKGMDFYLDAFFLGQTLGAYVGLSKTAAANADLVPSIGIAYALEKPINDNIAIGISPTLVSKEISDGTPVEILSNWLVYAIIGF